MKQENGGLHFQGLKTHILKFKCAIEKKLSQVEALKHRQEQREQRQRASMADEYAQIPQQSASSDSYEENLYQDRWETQLLNAAVAAGGAKQELGDMSQNPEELPLGVLANRG